MLATGFSIAEPLPAADDDESTSATDLSVREADAEPSARKPMRIRLDIDGCLRFDHDAQGDDWDALLYTDLRIDDLVEERVDLKISGWGLWDIDSNDDYDQAMRGKRLRMSDTYVDIHSLGPISRLRLGRQRLAGVDSIRFDGATAWTDPKRPLSFFAFGGRRVSYYESASGDWLGGAGAVWRPSWRTRHQIDSYYLDEGGESFQLSAWRWRQTWPANWSSHWRLRFIDAEMRDARLLIAKHIERWQAGVNLSAYYQPTTRARGDEAESRTVGALGSVLGGRAAHYQLGLGLYKAFGENWLAEGGGSIRRRVSGGHGRDTFNSIESESAHLSLTRFDGFVENLDLTLGGNIVHNERDDFYAITGSTVYEPSPQWRLSAAVSLSRYDFDPIFFPANLQPLRKQADDKLDRSAESLVYSMGVRWRPNDTWAVTADTAWEDNDDTGGNGFTAAVGLRYSLRTIYERE